MQLQLIRNATMKVRYADRMLLTDPMLAAKGTLGSFAGAAKNPTVELPLHSRQILQDLDGVVISHDHPDHYDKEAASLLPRDLTMFCQPGDEDRLAGDGFADVRPVGHFQEWEGMTITRAEGRHGTGRMQQMMGDVSGFVFQAGGEPTVYWAGDTVWCELVQQTIREFSPDIIVTHSCGAAFPEQEPIVMDCRQTLAVAEAAPQAVVVAVHMEALDHCWVTRNMLRRKADQGSIGRSRLLIPEDGEILAF
ncbi:MAG: MBL fold metallo-hydrolase [Thermodesulfobacteriota bacterium]